MGNHNSGRPLRVHTIRRALELVDRGLTHRRVAAMLGIGRDAVGRYVAARERRALRGRVMPRLPADGEGPRRCPTCGAMAEPPCAACALRGPAGG